MIRRGLNLILKEVRGAPAPGAPVVPTPLTYTSGKGLGPVEVEPIWWPTRFTRRGTRFRHLCPYPLRHPRGLYTCHSVCRSEFTSQLVYLSHVLLLYPGHLLTSCMFSRLLTPMHTIIPLYLAHVLFGTLYLPL